MKIAIILGTRLELIKMSPIIRECEKQNIDYYILYTGQHYSYEMNSISFEQLKLLQGDATTVLAGALAASKLQIKIGHVEAGLSSFDRTMPEETNRIVADNTFDHLFAPIETSGKYLLDEGISHSKIFVTGNRAENVDSKKRFVGILAGFSQIYKEFGLPIIFPAHPRTVKMIGEFGLKVHEGKRLIEPLGYLEFLQLESGARRILTDSGGVQEESCILKVPSTLRDNKERPETVP